MQVLQQSHTLGRVIVMSLVLQLFALAIPVLTGLVIDRVVPRGDTHLLGVVAGGLIALTGFQLLTTLIRGHLLLELRTRLDSSMTLNFVEHLVGLAWSFFQVRAAGDLLARMSSNATVREILSSSALSALLDGALVILYMALMFAISPMLGLLVLGLGLMQVLILVFSARRQRALLSESLEVEAKSQSYQVEMLTGIQTLKAFGVANLVSTASQLQLLGSYVERIDDVFDTPPERDPSKPGQAAKLKGGIELERVSFRYAPTAPLVVKDVSVRIEPGQFVAIVGRSGAGKSTLANLLLGLYLPTSGRVLYDGADLGDLDLQSVRSQMGVVPQEPAFFSTTLRGNIALRDPTLPLEPILEASKLARLHDDVTAMPMGYDTPLVDRGASLSGGQRQRLALARALVHSPAVLLLDEATSALDAITESQVQQALASLSCTRIVIAHRLSTVVDADLILVMDSGQLAEAGSHEELLSRRGVYAELVRAQIEKTGRLE